jgi:hypothetical protein
VLSVLNAQRHDGKEVRRSDVRRLEERVGVERGRAERETVHADTESRCCSVSTLRHERESTEECEEHGQVLSE